MGIDSEIDKLAQTSLLIVDALESKADDGANIFKEVKIIIEKTRVEKNLEGMKTLARDMYEWSSSLPNVDRSKLNDELLNIENDQS